MKNYLTQNRFKFLGGAVLFFAVLSLGAYCRPAYDFAFSVLVPEPKVYVATVQDNRTPLQKAMAEEVEKYKKTSDYTTLIEKIAVEHVGRMLSIDISSVTGEAEGVKDSIVKKQAAQVEQHKLREIYGISDKTATATITLETKAGRRPN